MPPFVEIRQLFNKISLYLQDYTSYINSLIIIIIMIFIINDYVLLYNIDTQLYTLYSVSLNR